MTHPIRESAFITRSALEESVGVDTHLELASQLLRRHPWPADRCDEVCQAIDRIQRRQHDESLYLAVVGEFSCGKSTLINALLGEEILKSDILPATTAAATVLRYGAQARLLVDFRDGSQKIYSDKEGQPLGGRSGLSDLLEKLTTVEEVAATVAQVTLEYPSRFPDQRVVIVDTPGSNVENERHVEVAGWAMREVCDAAIVAIPADVPAANTLMRFLREHLRDVLHRCLFVVTKIDRIRPAERPRLVKTIAARLAAQLELDDPWVMPASAYLALHDKDGGARDEVDSRLSESDRQELVREFAEVRKGLLGHLLQQRALIILERLSILLSQLFSELAYDLGQLEERYRNEHQALEETSIVDLPSFIEERKRHHDQQLALAAVELRAKIGKAVEKSQEKVRRRLKSEVDRSTTDPELRVVLTEKYKQFMEEAMSELKKEARKVFKNLRQATQKEVGQFEETFVALYHSLATLDGQLAAKSGETLGATLALPEVNGVSELEQLVRDDVSAEGRIALSGALTGGTIGSLIVPGVGTVVGAMLGALASSIFAPPIDQLKKKYWEKLRTVTGDAHAEVRASLVQAFDVNRQALALELGNVIDRYSQRYDELVGRMVLRDQEKARELAKRQESVARDLAELERRRQELGRNREELLKIRTI